MKLKIEVASEADGKEFGGTQIMEVSRGEFVLDEIFKLNFFRIIIDDIIGDALCFRLMEGSDATISFLRAPVILPFSSGKRPWKTIILNLH